MALPVLARLCRRRGRQAAKQAKTVGHLSGFEFRVALCGFISFRIYMGLHPFYIIGGSSGVKTSGFSPSTGDIVFGNDLEDHDVARLLLFNNSNAREKDPVGPEEAQTTASVLWIAAGAICQVVKAGVDHFKAASRKARATTLAPVIPVQAGFAMIRIFRSILPPSIINHRGKID
jgi:hypothetical protein